MPPPELIPQHPSVDDIFALHMWMANNDIDHQNNVRSKLGREPTPEEVRKSWFEEGALGFERTILALAQQ